MEPAVVLMGDNLGPEEEGGRDDAHDRRKRIRSLARADSKLRFWEAYWVLTFGGMMFVVLFRIALLPCELTTPPPKALTLWLLWLSCDANNQMTELVPALTPKLLLLMKLWAMLASVVAASVTTPPPRFW